MKCQRIAALFMLMVGLPDSNGAGGGIHDSQQAGVRGRDHRFSANELVLLEEIQHACFLYFWKEVGQPAALAKDRLKAPVSSIAAVGFQLSSLPIGVEHGWVSRDQARQRAVTVLQTLIHRTDNKKWGIYLHFPDQNTGGMSRAGYEMTASTVDTALFIAGAIPAAQYFKGQVKLLVDRLIADANWKAYAAGDDGLISMGWKLHDPSDIDGSGEFLPWKWHIASDEERLVYLLACGSPDPNHAVEPKRYYQLKREMKRYQDMPSYAVSWPGALFTYFFSHCWIDYRSLGPDDPTAFGINAPSIDWFENSRRAVLTHRRRCLDQAVRFKTFRKGLWGLSACAGRDGYIVPQVQPNLSGVDQWHDGTVAPYAAGSAIMFTPAESMAVLLAFRQLEDAEGKPFAWRDPAIGGYGFVDAINLDQGFASDDYVGIDQGPMLLAIENVRSGLIWRLFMGHPTVRESLRRLGLSPQ